MTREALHRAVEESDRYAGLLSRMSELTDELADAVRAADLSRIDSILTSREALCGQIASGSSTLGAAIEALGDRRALRDADGGTAWKSMVVSMEKVQQLRSSLLGRQAECGKLLAGKLSECGTELRALGQRRGLRTTYREPDPDQSSRFLDSRR